MPSSEHKRLWALTIGALALFGLLLGRLIDLQIVRASYFEAVAAGQRKRAAELTPHRGTIYLQEQTGSELFPVAVNQPAHIAYAVPRDIDDPLAIARILAPALFDFRERQNAKVAGIIAKTGQEPRVTPEPSEAAASSARDAKLASLTEDLYRKFNQKTDPYEPFLLFYENLDEELHQFLIDSNLPGIVIEEVEIRAYPEKTLAAHVLGYLGWQDERQLGRYGVEGYFDDELKGSLGLFASEKDGTGAVIGVGINDFKPPEDGTDIVLTIDRVVQSIIEEELRAGVERYGALRGSILVMDPITGAILGMATFPTFDPNHYYAISDARVQLNPVVSDIFEPGSILKPVIMAAALAEGLVTPETTFNDTGPVRVDKYTINTFDGQHHGVQTMTQILEQSNNVGMVWVGQQLGAETMYDYLRRFGLGEKTGLELEGETQSTLPEPKDWNIATIATTAFGQGVALTPLQALNAINAIASGGILTQPHIVERLRHQNGDEDITTPTSVRRVLPAAIADEAAAMMISVIENGVATLAQVPGYYMAGKTGTAQVPDETGSYDPDRKIISFVGFGPYPDPRFSILIKLDDPSGLSFASGTAAPMFGNIAAKLLNYYQVPPDYDLSSPPASAPAPTQDTSTEELG